MRLDRRNVEKISLMPPGCSVFGFEARLGTSVDRRHLTASLPEDDAPDVEAGPEDREGWEGKCGNDAHVKALLFIIVIISENWLSSKGVGCCNGCACSLVQFHLVRSSPGHWPM